MGTLTTRTITLGSRPSKLARWQSEFVLTQLQTAWPEITFRMVTLVTQGDQRLDRPLPEIGGKGLFTAELETALHAGEIDLAVHSLKDLPVESAAGLSIGAVSARANPRDVLISAKRLTLEELPLNARVGTSSLRRQAQILAARPDVTVLSLRGNVDTRLRKAMQGDYDAIILAAAGVERLGLSEYASQILPLDVMLPAPGQGALAVQCRADDAELLRILQPIHDAPTARAVTAERAFLQALGGGCSAPVAAFASVQDGQLEIHGLVAVVDGQQVIRVSAAAPADQPPEALGQTLARDAITQGAEAILRAAGGGGTSGGDGTAGE